jgi:S1-C subfamily serine protease
VAAGALYLSWYLAGSTSSRSVFSQTANQAVSATSANVTTATAAVPTTADASPSNSGPSDDRAPAANTEASEDSPQDTESPKTVPSTHALGPLDDGNLTSYSGESVGPLLESANREANQQRQAGLYQHRTGREPLARFIAHDGMVLTSASALAGRSRLSLWDTNDWQACEVTAIDPVSDIAVLEPERWSEQLDALARTIDPDLSPVERNQKVMIRPTTRTDAGTDGADVDTGAVVGLEERVEHRGGHAVYDGARTTIEFRSSLAGGRLVDDRGRTVGMIINGSSWSLTVMPIDSALGIADSLLANDEPHTGRLGVETITHARGAARVTWVDPDGPSAELLDRGDIIETWDGEPVLDADHLVHLVRRTPADRPVEIGVRHRGRTGTTILVPAQTAVND